MLRSDFLAHLSRRGILRDAENVDSNARGMRGRNADDEPDWVSLTNLTQSDFAEELANFYHCARAQRGEMIGGRFLGGQLSPRFLKDGRLFPYEGPSGTGMVAVGGPVDAEILGALETALGRPLLIAAATSDDIDAALAMKCGAESVHPTAPEETSVTDDNLDDLRDLAGGAPVVRALDELLRLAVEQRATDLHIEPSGGTLKTRLRIDGLLKTVPAPPASMAKGILSRLKIISGLNITERRLPQDGRARITVNGVEIDLRIATMPTMEGESAVVRLLRKGSSIVALEKLGLSTCDEAVIRRALQAPFGLIIVTGPTGSGKTTTLAASLAVLNESTRKILTIEDPVEYRIPGINQTQVHPTIGLTFASALRSFLRQDPDVIMVGEMRDAETASIGVHAALTGHLVLTTLHTNTAAGAITRLIDMKVESFLLASCIRAIVGQRLVRILCPDCKKLHCLTASDLAKDQRYGALGFQAGENIHLPEGCELCSNTGFRGRKGVFEVINVTPAFRSAIRPGCDVTELEKMAAREGMTTMTADGLAKCRAGLTTVDEVFRVTASL